MKFKTILITLSLSLGLHFAYATDSWKTDFAAALEEAKAQNKSILVDFTGSDWCGWCIKLNKEVFSQTAFKEFAASELVLVKIDFPIKKTQSEALVAQNKALADKYEVHGYPTILLLSPQGKLIGRTGYKAGGPETYIEHIKKIIGKQ